MSAQWNIIPSEEVINQTVSELKKRNFNPVLLEKKEDVLAELKKLIPSGSDVMTGSSVSLDQTGVSEYLQSPESIWQNTNGKVWSENDHAKRENLRREAVASNYYIASVNALTKEGQLIAVDATGNRVSAYPFAAKKLILVVGAQKIADNLEAAMQRIREYVFPLENERAKQAYGVNSTFGKWVIMDYEINPERVHVLIVKESIGY